MEKNIVAFPESLQYLKTLYQNKSVVIQIDTVSHSSKSTKIHKFFLPECAMGLGAGWRNLKLCLVQSKDRSPYIGILVQELQKFFPANVPQNF